MEGVQRSQLQEHRKGVTVLKGMLLPYDVFVEVVQDLEGLFEQSAGLHKYVVVGQFFFENSKTPDNKTSVANVTHLR